jgi:hypothetical protein
VFQTLRNLSTTRLKKFRFGPRSTAGTTESAQNSDQNDSEVVRQEKSTAVAEAANQSRDGVTRDDDSAGVETSAVDHQSSDVRTTTAEDAGNVAGRPSCNSDEVLSEAMSENAACSALPTLDVDQTTDDEKPVVLKRIPTRVSVAVQTDAYESDDYSDDDDDSSSSSGSWDSCSRSGDESSDEETPEAAVKFNAKMSETTREKNESEPEDAVTTVRDDDDDVLKAEIDGDVDDSGCVAAESSSDFPDMYENPLTTASARSISLPLENESCNADASDDRTKDTVCLGNARFDDSESARVSAVDSPTSVETSSDEESECEMESESTPASAGPTERHSCLFGMSNETSLPPHAPPMVGTPSADCSYGSPSLAARPAQCATVGVAEVQGDFERLDKARVDDVMMFKTPEQSPVDNRFGQSAATYQSSSSAVTGGSYGSSPSMYGAMDGSPSCVVATGNQSCLSINGNAVGYSLPTPSPTNSSSRSFSMASPSSAYQQPSSVGGTPTGFQFEPMPTMGAATGYLQEPARFQPAVPSGGGQGLIAPNQESYSPSAYHYGHPVSPLSVDQTGRNCPSAPMLGYAAGAQRSQSYKFGMGSNSSFPYASQWQQFGHQQQPSNYHHHQQQQQQQQHATGYFPQQAATDVIPHLAMDQRNAGQMSVAATGSRSSLNACDEKMMHRRCNKSCNKNCPAAYRGAGVVADVAAPNVAIQPGTNVITGYGSAMYDQSFPAGPQRKSNSTVHGGSSGGVQPPRGYATSDNRHGGLATFGYQGGYVGERYHQDMFATHAARTRNTEGSYTGHQTMSPSACLTPVHGSSRAQGAVYPNMAATYDPYVNSMTSFGMRWQNT